MKKRWLLPVLIFSFLMPSCSKAFSKLLKKANHAFNDKDYTVVIDSLTLGIPRWKEKDGKDKKAEAYQLLGKTYHALKKIDQAEDAYLNAIRLSDKTYDSAYALGIIYTASSKPKNAEDVFRQALRMKPNDPLALVGLGDSLFALGKLDEARDVYKEVLAVSPGVPEALQNLEIVANRQSSSNKRK